MVEYYTLWFSLSKCMFTWFLFTSCLHVRWHSEFNSGQTIALYKNYLHIRRRQARSFPSIFLSPLSEPFQSSFRPKMVTIHPFQPRVEIDLEGQTYTLYPSQQIREVNDDGRHQPNLQSLDESHSNKCLPIGFAESKHENVFITVSGLTVIGKIARGSRAHYVFNRKIIFDCGTIF